MKLQNMSATLVKKDLTHDQKLRQLSEETRLKIELEHDKKRNATLQAMDIARANELTMKQKADDVLKRKFSVAETQMKFKHDRLNATLEDKINKRQIGM